MSANRVFDIRMRIDLPTGCSIGPGKIALLEAIARDGTLSEAARNLGMSYRRAWTLLDDLNASLNERVATASVGGAGGGGVRLTNFGKEIVVAYREVEAAAKARVGARFARVMSASPSATRNMPKLRRSITRSARGRD